MDLAPGGQALDVEAARRAIERHVAGPLGTDVTTAAAGIIDIINNNMMGAIRVITVERGIDPRRFTLFGFGGAGPLHAASLARLLDIPTVLISRSPGVLSALGLLGSDLRTDFAQTCTIKNPTSQDIGDIFKILDDQALRWLKAEGVPQDKQLINWQVDLRYPDQVFELTIALDRKPDRPPDLATLYDSFHDRHEQLYTFRLHDSDVEIVNLRASAIGLLASTDWTVQGRTSPSQLAPQPAAMRPVYFNEMSDFVDCPIYDRLSLSLGFEVPGPALISQMDTTTLVLPGQLLRVDPFGNLIITNEPAKG
jgi:N-methylhydantoinase A